MKKVKGSEEVVSQIDPDEILPEYDFSRARRNKYARRYKKGALVVTLDPEVARVFPTAVEVGTPVFYGTRVTVQTLFEYLEAGEN